MSRYQPIYDIAELCSKKGIVDAVLSPGSRCAPLVLAFARHDQINTRTISDERSAGFIGLGLAEQTRRATVLLCTSGTAAYNFAPAIAEAFFSNIPLIVFTADRPSEWIAQQDGQTIHQQGLYGSHVKGSFQLPQDYDHPDSLWATNRIVNDAINLAVQQPQGPVHINAPFREPLYPGIDEEFSFSKDVRVIEVLQHEAELNDDLKKQLSKTINEFTNILIVAGQQDYNDALIDELEQTYHKYNLPLIGDILSNLHPIESAIKHADLFLGQATDVIKKTLQPDLLITIGGQVISKNTKVFLRNYTPKAHWHIQEAGTPADTFQHLTKIIQTSPAKFFRLLNSIQNSESFEKQKQSNYQKLWDVEERKTVRTLNSFFHQEQFAELEMVKETLEKLPEQSNLHLANSMTVRYANFIGLSSLQKKIRVYANRGTSGIDGCTSTAVGHSLADDTPNILITGDMAFFYDRNAFWHQYPLPNLRIVVLNNHGGIIFKIIDGPASLPEADEYFVTNQKLNAKKLCEEFGFDYLKIDNKRKINNTLKNLFEFDGTTKILEFESAIELNKSVFDNLKLKIKKSYEA